MTARGALRIGLALLAATQAVIGVWALPAPRAFYEGFPGAGHAWVALLPPYNEHLVRDVGAFSLAFTILLGAAARWPQRRFVRVALVTVGVFAVPHAVFHVTHLAGFPAADAVAQTAGILAQLLLLFGLLALTWWVPDQRENGSTSAGTAPSSTRAR